MRSVWLLIVLSSLSACSAARSAGDGVRTVATGWDEAASAPLEDLGLRRQAIPMVLLQANAAPYDQRNLHQCSSIAREVERLNEALGPDADEPPAPDGRLLSERASDAASKAALDAIREAATDFIPGRSWIRRLTGAEQHSRQVQEALQAGRLRRAFLKGLGMQRNCAPPAAPSWYRPRGINWPSQ
ncbi:hypothetical protein E4M02_09710 [Brevundimonas sp. S30B]|uniref:hypothetical protein n=1 Tax=unclassified Brevundimonas TaxID=2622653 RepID=UPI001071614F|nr:MULTISPECIES: hypothetical protein [unclassified Brevundimonas]QBX38300.1 hypothetical protein E4M01_11345 [Brevundimonas sp. MF30-B]TFW01563.1 hypothetical protein E4M02_09710 [Brevundimonas sp. S30B]